MGKLRPIRFATGAATRDPVKLVGAARRAEELGFSTFVMADHFFIPFAPLIALQAIADATSTLRLGQLVLAQDFRHPAILAKELATLDLLSGGRVEVGIGAGWIREEFEQAGIPFHRPAVRIERLEEATIVLKGLWHDDPFSFSGKHFTITGLNGEPKPVQRPHPPLLIGGGGAKLLGVAARQADIIQILPRPNGDRMARSLEPASLSAQAYKDRIDVIRDAAGDRFADIELGAMLLNVTVTDDAESAAEEYLTRLQAGATSTDTPAPTTEQLLSSPVVAIGTTAQICAKLLETRDQLGLTYFTSPVGVRPEVLAPIIERLDGV